MIFGRRRGDVVFMAAGGLVLVVGVWLLAPGHGSGSSDTGARPRVGVMGAYVAQPTSPNEVSVYFALRNTGGGADRLLGVRTDLSTVVMMHHGLQMISLDSVPVPAHSTVVFAPRGLHVMIMEPRWVPRTGDQVRLTLVFSRSDPQTISAPVIAAGGRPPGG